MRINMKLGILCNISQFQPFKDAQLKWIRSVMWCLSFQTCWVEGFSGYFDGTSIYGFLKWSVESIVRDSLSRFKRSLLDKTLKNSKISPKLRFWTFLKSIESSSSCKIVSEEIWVLKIQSIYHERYILFKESAE